MIMDYEYEDLKRKLDKKTKVSIILNSFEVSITLPYLKLIKILHHRLKFYKYYCRTFKEFA